ncbi:MAG: hypothetical protein JWO02_2732 [Solirubrobacterales bacterium]|nr:hypothetical protein [Solirubrobacterales bacterium]
MHVMISAKQAAPTAYDAVVRRPAPPSFWPFEHPKRVAAIAVSIVLVAGLTAIIVTGASIAYVGTLLVGCVALGTILASFLDRRRAPS